MTAKLLDGKKAAQVVKDHVKTQIQEHNLKPTLEVILVGDNPASQAYVKGKHKDCQEVGIESIITKLPETVTTVEVIQKIQDSKADGIIVQLPLPKHIDQNIVIDAIPYTKDVDCFRNINLGNLFTDTGIFSPCTPLGIMELLWEYKLDVVGKHCVIIGRSNIVGKPLALMLINVGATVTVCNSHTQNLKELTKQADILVSAVGKPKFVTADMVKDGAVVVDVGINRTEDGKLCGDVDFEKVSEVASWITPVPGGVGLMTRAMLLQNTVWACENNRRFKDEH